MAECPHAAAPDTVLQCVDLCKCYNGVVQASDHVNFTLRRGEVHAFLGENGAGKSTLMKMLYGIEQPDEGRLYLSGQPVTLKSPADAIAHGIGMVHQELMLIPHLTVAENITLGQEIKTRGGRLKSRRPPQYPRAGRILRPGGRPRRAGGQADHRPAPAGGDRQAAVSQGGYSHLR